MSKSKQSKQFETKTEADETQVKIDSGDYSDYGDYIAAKKESEENK